jgi:tripartite-type tricarboxylate transporter receptor subunit TctC
MRGMHLAILSTRRQLLHLAVGAMAVPAVVRSVHAQAYPTRPVRIVVGTVAGATPDIVARLIGGWLSDRLGQPFVIENRPGAGGNLGAEVVVRAAPDGYTLHLAAAANAINATLYRNLSFNYLRDMAPVAGFARTPLVMEANPSVAAKTVSELIALAKANPGKLNMASGGIGTPQHVSGELFKLMAGVNMQHVPYRGAALALTDLISGQVQVMFDTIPASIEFIRAGKLHPLAVTSATPLDILPGLPTIGDVLPGYEATSWSGIAAPKGTPADIVQRLNQEINAALADPGIVARIADLGSTVLPGSSAEFGNLLAEETDKWAKVVKFSGATSE